MGAIVASVIFRITNPREFHAKNQDDGGRQPLLNPASGLAPAPSHLPQGFANSRSRMLDCCCSSCCC